VTGIDTNVLVRFLTNDDPRQAPVAKRLIEARTAAQPAYVNLIVLVETLWVLRRTFAYPGAEVCALVSRLIATEAFRIEKPRLVEQAVKAAQEGGFDLPDTLIALLNGAAGCGETWTFDRGAAAIPGMQALEEADG
jgi:predicted nucleic-acid-binding protein